MATAAPAAELKIEEPLPHGFHNLFVILIMGIVVLWIMKVAWQLFKAADLNARLANHQSLQLEGMSIYANDFQMLIRQHFNQILRIRRTVPPKRVPRHSLSIHVHPDSLTVYSGDGSQGAFGVQFTVDAMVSCCVKLFWGVSVAACNEFVRQHAGPSSSDAAGPPRWGAGEGSRRRERRQRSGATTAQESTRSLLEMEELNGVGTVGPAGGGGDDNHNLFLAGQYIAQSRDFFLPAGAGQRYATPAGDLMDPSQLNIDLSAPWLREGSTVDDSTVMPLAIVAIAQRRPGRELGEIQGVPVVEAQGEVSFVKFRQNSSIRGYGPGIPEIVRQLSFGDKAAHEIQGIFGFEEEEGDSECMICYNRPKNVLLLPCRHCSVCHPCLRSLRDEKCPLCRSPFSSYVTFPITRSSPSTQESSGEAAPPGHAPPPSGSGSAGDEGNSSAQTQDASNTAADKDSGGSGGRSGSGNSSSASAVETAAAGNDPGGSESSTALPMQVSSASARQVLINVNASGEAATQPGRAKESSASQGAAVTPVEMRSVTPREAPSARPRGTAPAPRSTAQSLRLSGRARFSERADTAETPLLQEGGNSPMRGASGAEMESDDCRRDQASAMCQPDGPNEETCILADV